MDSPGGKKPKSAAQIRDKLASVRELAGRPADLGPHAGGLQATDRIAVATFFDPACAKSYQEKLLVAGIHSISERREGRVGVLVDLEDRAKAVELLDAHLTAFPDRRHRRTRAYEATIILSLIGLLSLLVTLVAVGNVDEPNRVTVGSILGAFRVTGAITLHLACFGLLVDLIRSRRLDLGRGQFNLIFVLWLTTAAALLLYWR